MCIYGLWPDVIGEGKNKEREREGGREKEQIKAEGNHVITIINLPACINF